MQGLAEALRLLEEEVGQAYPAAALAVAERGALRLLATAGAADLDTWFDLASLTKALCTSLLCMRLYQQGRLDLEEEPLPGVTVRHLLSHSSGLPAWLPLHAQAGARRDVVAAAAAAPRGPAGQRAVYSDLGFILLGHLCEERGGERLDRLFAQVGAPGLGFHPSPERCAPTRQMAAPWAELRGTVHDDNARAMEGVAGHAGLFGTVRGVARLGLSLCQAYQGQAADLPLGVSAETVGCFFARQPGPPGTGSTWGLGWDHPSAELSAAGQRWSPDGVGHLGFTGCSLWMDPPRGRLVVLLSNRAFARGPEETERSKARLKALRPRLHDAVSAALAADAG